MRFPASLALLSFWAFLGFLEKFFKIGEKFMYDVPGDFRRFLNIIPAL